LSVSGAKPRRNIALMRSAECATASVCRIFLY
jgi:hypothetical protein